MNIELSDFAARLAHLIPDWDNAFDETALELFGLQFEYNPAYRRVAEVKGLTPRDVRHWTQVPFVPTAAFKELELTSIPSRERTGVFHSSGTTEQRPSRHFHCGESLRLYELSLWTAFRKNVPELFGGCDLVILSPSPKLAPHSSLAHMFEVVRRRLGEPETAFVGHLDGAGSLGGAATPPYQWEPASVRQLAWAIDLPATVAALRRAGKPKLILGTAFSFVHLTDFLARQKIRLSLPEGSRAMETGGYKNRSRAMPRAELHSLITEFLGIPREAIIREYGMSELGSQAYDRRNGGRDFHFPPWTRAQIISPETGREVDEGQAGLIRIFDLANVFSVSAIQTEDLGVRRGDGFELIGRAALAEARGCSLMMA
ncbi:MAG: hypothetical protein ACRED1_10400 [Limisphaerales bacterium]